MSRPLLVGTNNQGKVRELQAILQGLPYDLKILRDFPSVPEPVEDGTTFEQNALKKAAYFAKQFDVACVADDSGLVVDVLDGAPGVYSARYGGPACRDEDNIAKLLAELDGAPAEKRTARFQCCAALVTPEGTTHVETGSVEGRIITECRGNNGFGYDPLFIADGFDQTFAELAADVKESISHRGRAFRKLKAYLESLL